MESAGVSRESESSEVMTCREDCDEQDDELDVDEQLDLNTQRSKEDVELNVDQRY
jgi:hypothetical protein